MQSEEIQEIVEAAVNTTIAKIKTTGILNDKRKTAFQKTEEVLKKYPEFKKIRSKKAVRLTIRIDNAIKELANDPYIDIIRLFYFENMTRESIAGELNTSVRTVGRNKRRLVNELKVMLFADDVIYELFM